MHGQQKAHTRRGHVTHPMHFPVTWTDRYSSRACSGEVALSTARQARQAFSPQMLTLQADEALVRLDSGRLTGP